MLGVFAMSTPTRDPARVPGWVFPLAILVTVLAWRWAEFISATDARWTARGDNPAATGVTAPVRGASGELGGAGPVAHAERGGQEHETVPRNSRTMPNPLPALPEVVAKGQLAFQTYCWVCHGRGAQGNGPAAPGLDPRPYDLTGREVQQEPDGYLFYRISEGIKGTAMPAWRHSLDEQTRWAIVRYLRTRAPNPAPQQR